MGAPRLDLDLGKLAHNARSLVDRLAIRGVSVTGVTKACLGSPKLAATWLCAGVRGLADSRIENLESMRLAGVVASMTLIRTPMLSQAERVVASADISFNTELDVIDSLSGFAVRAAKQHRVVLMVELGDLREGILPAQLEDAVRETLRLPNIVIEGLGANLACRSGVGPSDRNMAELSSLAQSIESTFHLGLGTISGGNSANLPWALKTDSVGRINDLRLGEALLLGREPLARMPIEGLHTDAITLTAEVIESKLKPTLPWGRISESAFGALAPPVDRGPVWQTILAVGRQDIDPEGLLPAPGVQVLGVSSDHLVAELGTQRQPVGSEVTLGLDYSCLLRAMTSPFVTKVWS